MNKIVFTKYSNERAKAYALRTDIVDGPGGRLVCKKAMYPQGISHIRSIAHFYEELSRIYRNTGIRMNRCEQKEDEVRLEYLEGETLENILDGYLLEEKHDLLIHTLFSYLDEVKKGFTREKFVVTAQFEEVFGPVSLPEGLLCADTADIDMVLNNVLVNDGWTLIDYEWSFDFPIPYHFVVFRILNYYLHGSSTRSCLIPYDLMGKAGLTQEEVEVYRQMEEHFQKVYVLTDPEEQQRHVPVRFLYDDITPGILDVRELGFQALDRRGMHLVQLYQAPDMGFSEEKSEKRSPGETGCFQGTFRAEEQTQYVRLDPASACCVVRHLSVIWGTELCVIQTNGYRMEDGGWLFVSEDPQMLFARPEGADAQIQVQFSIEYLTAEEALRQAEIVMGELQRQKNEMNIQLENRQLQIQQMENTKIWKAYRKLKKG